MLSQRLQSSIYLSLGPILLLMVILKYKNTNIGELWFSILDQKVEQKLHLLLYGRQSVIDAFEDWSI